MKGESLDEHVTMVTCKPAANTGICKDYDIANRRHCRLLLEFGVVLSPWITESFFEFLGPMPHQVIGIFGSQFQ